MRHLTRLVLLLIALAILVPSGARAAGSSRNPNQRHAKQNYKYKVPKLKYKAPKVKGHHKARH
jgi:hypothetical protein